MRDDYAVFVITHKRAHEQLTLNLLQKTGFKGAIYLVVDDADPETELYQKIYGDIVLVFSKKEYWIKTDTYMNKKNFNGAVYARNACTDFARNMGYKYYFVCDDDIKCLYYKVIQSGKMTTKKVTHSTDVLDAVVRYLESASRIKAVGLSCDAHFIGGINNDVLNGVKYHIVKFVLYRAEDPLEYKGIVYEDMITPWDAYQKGELCFSYMGISQTAKEAKQGQQGGCQDLYAATNEYVNCFYLVMCRPDAVRIVERNGEFKTHTSKKALVPKIISEKWRKTV